MKKNLYPAFSILLVDDELPFLRSMSLTLKTSGINNLILCQDSRKVMETLETENIGLVLLDLTMPHLSGEELLLKIKEERPEIGVIVISGLNQLEIAVDCIKNGALDYFIKTTETDRLIKGISKAVQLMELEQVNQKMRSHLLYDKLEHPEAFADIITCNKAMRSVFHYIEAVAQSTQPILIMGESGSGKELIARAIHKINNCQGPLIAVNVAGLDDNIFADTLFGHSKGAFTSAEGMRSGMIEQAAEGTLFLDEIGDLSIASQIKLLRLLQEGEYFPLGSDTPKRLKARIVVATHQNLAARQAAGEFRKDLFYRLRTHHVSLPPLRERKEDIPLLLTHFLEQAAEELGKKVPTVPRELNVLLANYAFPGNIREFKAMVYDAMSLHQEMKLSMQSFKRAIDQCAEIDSKPQEPGVAKARVFDPAAQLPLLHEITDLLVLEAMERAEGNQSIACRLLGISQPALSKRLKKMNATT